MTLKLTFNYLKHDLKCAVKNPSPDYRTQIVVKKTCFTRNYVQWNASARSRSPMQNSARLHRLKCPFQQSKVAALIQNFVLGYVVNSSRRLAVNSISLGAIDA